MLSVALKGYNYYIDIINYPNKAHEKVQERPDGRR